MHSRIQVEFKTSLLAELCNKKEFIILATAHKSSVLCPYKTREYFDRESLKICSFFEDLAVSLHY